MEGKVLVGEVGGGIETEMVERAHAASMDKDPAEAARGRFTKQVGVAFMRWLEAEIERSNGFDDFESLSLGFTQCLSNIVITFAINSPAPENVQAALARAIASDIGTTVGISLKKGAVGQAVLAAREFEERASK